MKNQHDEGRRDGQFVLSTPTDVENELPFQLIGAGCDFYQYPIKRPFGFPLFQWIQTISGCGLLESPHGSWKSATGQGVLLYPDEEHTYYAVEEPWYVHWISFSGHDVLNMLHYLDMKATGVYTVTNTAITSSRIRKALQILQSDYPLRGIDGSATVYALLLDFLKYIQPEGGDSRDNHVQRLKPALDLIEDKLHQPLTLEHLASTIGVTPQYFCDLFRSVTSHRPTDYINQRRVDRAKELLFREPLTRVHDIGRRVGFESDSYFSTVFRKYEGVSPRKFREVNAGNAG